MRFFDVTVFTKIPFFRVLFTIEQGRSLLQFVSKNCLIISRYWISSRKINAALSNRTVPIPVAAIISNRPILIVTEILKKQILIPIDASKESDFYDDFKYIGFIKFNSTYHKLRARENLPYFRKKGGMSSKSHKSLMKITPSDSAYELSLLKGVSSSSLQKCWILYFFFCQKKDHGCVFICCCFFFQRWSYRPSGPWIS